MENLKSLEGKKVRVFEATYNHSSFAAPICIVGRCTFVDVDNGWIALDGDKIFNAKFLNRIEIVDEENTKKKREQRKKEEKALKRAERKAKIEAKKAKIRAKKAVAKKEQVEMIIDQSKDKEETKEDAKELNLSDEDNEEEIDIDEEDEKELGEDDLI